MARKKRPDEASIKSFQIKMNAHAHALIKNRSQQLGITIGEFIENLLASLEIRIERAKTTSNIAPSIRNDENDEIDAKLIKFLLGSDKKGLSSDDIMNGINEIKGQFEGSVYQPTITIDNGE